MEFRLLGPLEVFDGDCALELGGRKRRALLALLLLHANEVVSTDRLIDELWGDEPPQAAATALHGHVSRLRKLLPGEQLVTRSPGYVLQLEPSQLDLHRFESLREEARAARGAGDLAGASAKLREALSLWRGLALADLEYERFAQVEAGRLEELRLATVEERVDVDLELGRHSDLVAELERLVAEHPLREGFRAQLMLALYRSGRQAEALQVYQDARRVLLDELGIEPGQRLRDLEQAILRQDESLRAPETVERSRRRRRRRVLVPLLAVCVAGAAAALGLFLAHVGRRTAAHAYPAGTLLIDAKNKKQTAFFPPGELAQPTAPVYAHGHIWLLNLSPSSFVEIDPVTGRKLAWFRAPDGVGDARAIEPFAVQQHVLWVGEGDDLVKIDQRSGGELDRFKLDELTKKKGQAQGVALGGGLVWVGRDVDPGSGEVIAIDPRTREVRHRFDVRHHVDLAFDDGIVWASDSGGVSVIDPETARVKNVDDLESFDPYYGSHPTGNGVAAGGGFGWTTDPAKGVVYKIDRTGRIVEPTFNTGVGTTGVSYNDGAVWVRNEDTGTVTRIDPDTRQQTVYRFGHSVAAQIEAKGVLLAALEPGPTTQEYIGSLDGKVLQLFSKDGELGVGREPAVDWDFAADLIWFATCANLLRHTDGPDGLRLLPEVAAKMPSISRDRRTYTFTIRRGYRFSPPVNEALTARTFRDSFERAASYRLVPNPFNAPGPGPMEDVQGFAAFRSGKARHISGLHVDGDHLSITLTRPSADFLQGMAGTAGCPVPRDTPSHPGDANLTTREDPNAYTMPSAGPYYVAKWRDGKYVILKRNPNYHGPRPQRLDFIVLREGVDVSVALDAVRHGGWDGIVSSGHASSLIHDPRLDPGAAIAKQYGTGSPAGLQYKPATMAHTTFISLNAVSGPLADPTVRRAIAFAVDRTAIAPIWDSAPTDQLLPPVVAGFRDRTLYPLQPDLARAKALMHGRRLKVVMDLDRPGDAGLVEEYRLLRQELDPIGIQLVGGHIQGEAEEHALKTGQPRIDVLDGGLFDGPDGASFLAAALTSGAVPPWWVAPAVRRAVERVNRLSGSERETAAGALADRLLENEVPLVAIGNRAQGELFAPTVGCRVFPPTAHGVDLAALCRRDG